MSDNFKFNVDPQPTPSGTTIASRKRKGLHPQNGVAHGSVDEGKEYPTLKRFKVAIEHIRPSSTISVTAEDNITTPTHFSEQFTIHDDSYTTSQAPDPPVIHPNSEYVLNDHNSIPLDPQEFSFDHGASDGHDYYLEEEYERGVDHTNFTEEEEHMESTFDKEGVQDARTASFDPDYYPGYVDVPGSAVTVDSSSDDYTIPLGQPNYSRNYSPEQSMNTMPTFNEQLSPPVGYVDASRHIYTEVTNGTCFPHDGTELATEEFQVDNSSGRHLAAGRSGYLFTQCNDTDTITSCFDPFTEDRGPSDSFETVKGEEGKAEQSKAEEGEAEQSKAAEGEAEQSEAEEGKAEQSEAEEGKAEQGKAEGEADSDAEEDEKEVDILNPSMPPFETVAGNFHYSQPDSAMDGRYPGRRDISMYEGEHESDDAPMRDALWDATFDADRVNTYEGEYEFQAAPSCDVTSDVFFDMLSNITLPSPDVPMADTLHPTSEIEDHNDLLEGVDNGDQGFDHHGHDGTNDPGVDNNYQWFSSHPCDSGLSHGDAVDHDSGVTSHHQGFDNYPHPGAFHDPSGAPGDIDQGLREYPHQFAGDKNLQMEFNQTDDGIYTDNKNGPGEFETPTWHSNNRSSPLFYPHANPISNRYNIVAVEEIEDENDYAHTLNNLGMGDPIIHPVSAMGWTERLQGRRTEYFEFSDSAGKSSLHDDVIMDHGENQSIEVEDDSGPREHLETENNNYLRGLSPLTDIPDTPRPRTSEPQEHFETGNGSYIRGLSPLTDIPDTPKPQTRVFATDIEAFDSLFSELASLVDNGVKSPAMKSHFLSQMKNPKFDYDTLRALLDRCYRYVGTLPRSASSEHDINDEHISPDSSPPPKLYKAPKHRPENKNYLAEKVRYKSGILLGIIDPNVGGGEPIFQPDKLATASQSAIKDFKNTRHDGPTIDNFVLQLDAGKLTIWNKAAADIFCKHFHAQEGHQNYRTKDVYTAFMSHITQLKQHFHRKGRPKTVQEKDEEKLARRLARRHSV
ncbi:hypothetical protein F5877DRAFT_72849 [Lentinula edodes]|nr:hypothetical protein F5877DRAFT_72849 [Lentinula edodes]